jgi:hypothetical protein
MAANDDQAVPSRGIKQDAYDRLLDGFGATGRSTAQCVLHLVAAGLTKGQARNAIYRYRKGRSQPPKAGEA